MVWTSESRVHQSLLNQHWEREARSTNLYLSYYGKIILTRTREETQAPNQNTFFVEPSSELGGVLDGIQRVTVTQCSRH